MAHPATMTRHDMLSTPRVPLAEVLAAHAHRFLRAGLAVGFLYHGLQKCQDLEGYETMMNLPDGVGLLVALAEVCGGVLIVAGALISHGLTHIGAAMFIPVMLSAILMIHWPQWSFVPSESHPMGGMEFQVVLLLTSLYFLVKGNHARGHSKRPAFVRAFLLGPIPAPCLTYSCTML